MNTPTTSSTSKGSSRSRKWSDALLDALVPSVRLDHRLYAIAVFTSGMGLLSLLTSDWVRLRPPAPQPLHVALWLGMLVLAIVAPIPLPKRNTSASLASVLEFSAIVAFGPAVACWLGVSSRLLANASQRWGLETLLVLGRSALAVGVAGFTYTHLGGRTGANFALQSGSLLPVLASALGLVIARHAVITVGDLLSKPERSRSVLREHAARLAWDSTLLPFALPLVVAETRLGTPATLLMLLPLVLARHVRGVWRNAKRSQLEAVRTLMSALDSTDPFTRGHAYRISKMCVAVGRHLGFKGKELEVLEYAALLHDVGRTSIWNDTLLKPGPLTHREQSLLRMHPQVGRDVVERIGFFPEAAELIYAHHEQPDGHGYPSGSSAADIPWGSRIIMAVAAFDAMTSDRPYRRGLSPEAAFDELLRNGGTQFFTEIVEALIDLYASGRLFAQFEPEVLAIYERGDGNSRAVREYLERMGRTGRDAETTPALSSHAPEPDLPEVDLAEVQVPRVVRRTQALTEDAAWRLTAAAVSIPGRDRANNEDAFGVFPGPDRDHACLLVVADGMGGAAGGEVASRVAVETVHDHFLARAAVGGRRHAAPEAAKRLQEAILDANTTIQSMAARESHLGGMGTTCVAAYVRGLELTVAHVGDSRAYLVQGNTIRGLTTDHNLAEEFKSLVGSEGPAGSRNLLTRSLGQESALEVDVTASITLDAGTTVVLCTDGLSNVVGEEDILRAVRDQDPELACKTLVDLARARRAPDDTTIAIARIEHADH